MFCRRTILDSVIICISSIQMGVKYIYISVFLNKPFQYIGIVNYKTIYKYIHVQLQLQRNRNGHRISPEHTRLHL